MFNRFFAPPSSLVGLWSQRALGYSVLLMPRVFRRALVRSLLTGEAGARWARFYLHASGEIDYSQPKYRALDALLTNITGHVQWIGCCSGREVAWFAERHPTLTFHASDLSASAVDLCRKTYQLPNLRFDVQDVTTATFGDDLVVSFGVLAYLDGPQIAQTALRVKRLFAAEPLPSHWQGTETTYAGRMAWNHPYDRVFACTSYQRHATGVIFTVGV